MSEDNHLSTSSDDTQQNGRVSPLKGGLFLVYVTLISGAAGFGLAVARAKKSSPKNAQNVMSTEGTKLAIKALGYGTAISVTGCGVLVFAVAKALGVSGPKEFSFKMKEILPAKDGEFVHKFDNWPTKMEKKVDDGKWRDDFK